MQSAFFFCLNVYSQTSNSAGDFFFQPFGANCIHRGFLSTFSIIPSFFFASTGGPLQPAIRCLYANIFVSPVLLMLENFLARCCQHERFCAIELDFFLNLVFLHPYVTILFNFLLSKVKFQAQRMVNIWSIVQFYQGSASLLTVGFNLVRLFLEWAQFPSVGHTFIPLILQMR